MSMSLDGYVADSNDGVVEVFDWYFNSGNVEVSTGGGVPMTFKVSEPSAKHLYELTSGLGAVLTGRRTFEVAHGWGGRHAWGPAFVLTHAIPSGWPRADSTVHFVLDGLESAAKQAKAAAGEKSVGVHGADTIQQLLKAGLLDELSIDVAAVLLGSGIRLFDRLASAPAFLGNPDVIQGSVLRIFATLFEEGSVRRDFALTDSAGEIRSGLLMNGRLIAFNPISGSLQRWIFCGHSHLVRRW